MIEKIKTYFVDVIMARLVPMAAMSATTALAGLWAAHQNLLVNFGIFYSKAWPFVFPVGHNPEGSYLLIELSTLTQGAIAAIAALLVSTMRGTEYHVMKKNTPETEPEV